MEQKKWYLSKTIWVNLVILLITFFPGVEALKILQENSEALFFVANTFLRIFGTEKRIEKAIL